MVLSSVSHQCLLIRSIQAVDVEAVAVTVTELVSYALLLNSNNQSWLITQADIYFGKKMF